MLLVQFSLLPQRPEFRAFVGGQLILYGSGRLRDGSWQGLSVFGSREEEGYAQQFSCFLPSGTPSQVWETFPVSAASSALLPSALLRAEAGEG